MSKYIDLGRTPNSPEERLSLLNEQVKLEVSQERQGLNLIQQRVFDFLLCEKGYPREAIETNKPFRVSLPDVEFTVKADLALRVRDIDLMVIKCAINSIESWERYSIAFGRTALEGCHIPFAVVTDSERYIIIDVLSGEVISDDREAIPSYDDLLRIADTIKTMPYDSSKTEREKRILHAFNALRCSEDQC